MGTQVPPLQEILAEVPDHRHPQGKRYPLDAMLTVVGIGLLCGYRTIKAIAEWGPNYGEEYVERLGFDPDHGYPSESCWYRVLGGVKMEVVEQQVRAWGERVLAVLSEGQENDREGLSIDGKTLRGSAKQGAEDTHLLSAYAQQAGVMLAQQPVADKTNEQGIMEDFLLGLVLEGRVVSTDALLTHRSVVQTIIDGGGDYVMTLKKNESRTYEAIARWFAEPPPYDCPNEGATSVEKQHGRITQRRLEATTALNAYLNWAELARVYQLKRITRQLSTGEKTVETRFGITSLSPDELSAQDLLALTRRHWFIENKLHWVRDVTFDEDRSQLRAGCLHHLMALFRSLVISVLRLSGWHNIASALRYFAAQPDEALALFLHPLPI